MDNDREKAVEVASNKEKQNNGEMKVFSGASRALEALEKMSDDDFVISSSGREVNTDEFEDATDYLAIAWRLLGGGHKNEVFDKNKFKVLLKGHPRLRFYLTYKVLSEAYETENELRGAMTINTPEVSWKEELVEVMTDEVDRLNNLDSRELEQRLSVYADLTERFLQNVDMVDIDRLLMESAGYRTEPIGESYLSLEQIERILNRLNDGLNKDGGVELTSNAANYMLIISDMLDRLHLRREVSQRLSRNFFGQ